MPRKNRNAGARSGFGTGLGAQTSSAFIPAPLGAPKYTRRPGGTDGLRRSR